MGRSEDLFNKIQREGVAAINQLIADAALEEGFLDFKRASNDGAGPTLSADDNRNFSKAISGFANSGGGLLVWGVDCRRDAAGIERPISHPLLDARGFRTKLEGVVSRLSIPAHTGVRNLEVISDNTGAGYVVTEIPAADLGPVRAEAAGLRNYYIRAGASFEVIPHDALAGLFGRSPRTAVEAQLIMLPLRIDTPDARNLLFGFGLSVANIGQILAEDVYASIWRGALSEQNVTVQVRDEAAYVFKKSSLPSYQLHARDGLKLVPGGVDDLAYIQFKVPLDRPVDVSIELTVGARGAAPKVIAVSATQASIAAAIEQYRQPGSVGSSNQILIVERVT